MTEVEIEAVRAEGRAYAERHVRQDVWEQCFVAALTAGHSVKDAEKVAGVAVDTVMRKRAEK